MEILSDYMVLSSAQENTAFLLCLLIAAFVVILIFFVVSYFVIGITINRLIGGLVCLCLLCTSAYVLRSIKPSLHRIKAIFTEDVSMDELSEKFKIIDQEGRIYTLQYKED